MPFHNAVRWTSRPAARLPGPRSLASQLFAMQAVLITLIVAWCAIFAYANDRARAEETAGRNVLVAAHAIADSPSVRAAIRTPDPTAELQPYAERVRRDTGVNFITIMDTDGIRWTHPDPGLIGLHFLGTTAPALHGRTFTETYTGTLGASKRAVTPIRDGGRIVGLVSVGITVHRISTQVAGQLQVLVITAGSALILGGLGTYVINARLRRHTHGLNARELSRMYDYHQAALHAMHEGLLMLDGRRRIALINDAGRELLGLDDSAVGAPVVDLGLPVPLTGALLTSEPRVDEVHLTDRRIIVVNTRPVVGGEHRGTVVTLRDHTELQALAGELDTERSFVEALRSQAHEAANRLHTVVSLIELDRVDQAVAFATAELELAQVLTDQVVGAVAEPVLAALLLGKAAQANERGVELVLTADSRIDDGVLPSTLSARDLVTILGNLIDNAVEAGARAAENRAEGEELVEGSSAGRADLPPTGSGEELPTLLPNGPSDGPSATDAGRGTPRVMVTALTREAELLLRVRDFGPGIAQEELAAVFRRGWSSHGPGRGLGLALVQQAVHRARGNVEVTSTPEGGAEFTVRLPLGTGTARSGTARTRFAYAGATARAGTGVGTSTAVGTAEAAEVRGGAFAAPAGPTGARGHRDRRVHEQRGGGPQSDTTATDRTEGTSGTGGLT